MTLDPYLGDLETLCDCDPAPPPRLHRPGPERRPGASRLPLAIVVVALALAWGYCWQGWRRAEAERDTAVAGANGLVERMARGGGR